MGKLLIFSAPSGSGKSTIVNFLLSQDLNLHFSISATSRPPRGNEQNGVEYYFLTPDDFRKRIANDEFLEFEEVYKDRYYGTLKAEVDRILANGGNVVFDLDVVGGCNMKKHFGEKALSVFVEPPSIEELERRLKKRATDSDDIIRDRINKAAHELTYAKNFDIVIHNDDLEKAQQEALFKVREFLKK